MKNKSTYTDGPLIKTQVNILGDPIPLTVDVKLLKVFRQGYVLVESQDQDFEYGAYGCWLVKDKFPWADFLKIILRSYELGKNVPIQFRPLKKIPQELIDNMKICPLEKLSELFDKLREKGFIAILPELNNKALPKGLTLDQLRPYWQEA